MRKSFYTLGLVSLLAVTACGGQEKDPFDSGSGPVGAVGPALNSTLKGKIAFEGTAPTPKKIQTGADPACMNPGLMSEEVVVSDGGLENVIIFVSGGLEGKSFPRATATVELDQLGCQYVPHAITLQTGQKLLIKNSDNTAHNVHAWAETNTPFNESQAQKGSTSEKSFDKEEIMFPIRCDVHIWMNAFVGVFSHPLSTTSKTGGAFEMKMPAGTYEITAIHEKLGKKTQMVEVAENGTAEINITFNANDKPAD